MKTQPIKVTSQPARKFPGLLAAFIIALPAFSALPIAWSADLYWSGDGLHATPPVAGDGAWRTDPYAVNWSDKKTSIANVSWIDGDVAHFLGAKGGTVTLGTNVTAAGIDFDPSASAFTINTNGNLLTVQDAGIANESGTIQAITNNGEASGISGGTTIFSNFRSTSTAGDVTITNQGAAASATSIGASGGLTQFYNASNAGKATIINNGSAAQATQGGLTQFFDTSTAGSATITNNGANDSKSVSGTEPGGTFFEGASSAGNATINNNGAAVRGAGGITVFRFTSSAGNATITNNGAPVNGGGGTTEFFDRSDGGTARVITNGNGSFDISGLSTTGMGIGSIEGSGNYFLGNKTLTVGGNNLSTVVSGLIQDGGIRGDTGGSLTKVGAGTLTLSGNNSYSGVTTIDAGVLQLGSGGTSGSVTGNVTDNGTLAFDRSDSVRFGGVISGAGSLFQLGTGTTTLTSAGNSVGTTVVSRGALLINGSLTSSTVTAGKGTTLGGTGSITGVVTLAAGATLAPGPSAATTGVLTVGSLILNQGSILAYDLQTPNLIGPQNDRVDVHGNLTLAGTLDVTDAGSFASTPGSYRLINYTGTLTGTASDLRIGRTPGYTLGDVFVQTVVPGQVNLITVLKGLPVEYWDGSGVTGKGVISGGSGIWNDSAPNWINANGTINQSWIPGMAIFTGAAGTVTLGENMSARAMQFSTDGYEIVGNGHTITLLGMPNSNLSLIRVDPGSTATFGATLVGKGGLNKADSGTLILSRDNTYTGGTVISGGTLQIGNGGTSGIISGNIDNNGTVAFDRSDSVTLSGAIAGHGNLVQLGSGTLALVGNNGYTGGTLINDGTLVAASNNALGTGPVTVAGSSSTLQINSGVTLTTLISLHNGGTLNNSGTLNDIPSALLVSDGGTIVNSAGAVITADQIHLTQAPATLVNSGTIHANVEFANFANTVQLFTGSSVVGNLNLGTNAGSNLILDGPGTQSLRQAVTGSITDSGTLTKQGTGTWIIDEELNAPVSTNVLAGVLTVDNRLNSPFVTVQSGATLMGTGNISGSVTNYGNLSPGNSPGTLTINGNYTQARSGAFNVQIASATGYDQLAVAGRANLDGTLRLTLLSGYRPGSTDHFTILTAGKGISGAFRTVIGPSGVPLQVIYGQHGVVQVTSGDFAPAISGGVVQLTSDPPPQAAPKPEFHLSDGTPDSTTALLANNTFNGFGSLAERLAASNKSSSIGITFDAGEFHFQGYHGETYAFPIAGQFKINDRARLEYEIPLQYVELPGSNIFQAGLTLDAPVKVITVSDRNPWTWTVAPTAAFASSGSKEIIGAGALSNVISYRLHDITLTYGNYISYFAGHTLTSNDDQFGTAVSQQIMKNGLRMSIPFAKSWLFESYAIYTQFFQSAPVSSYVTIGAEVGHHFTTYLYGREVDLGYLSTGLYTELGNQYSSGHFKIGSAWKF